MCVDRSVGMCVIQSAPLLLQEVKGERRSGRMEFDVAAEEEKKNKPSNLLNNDSKV